MLHKLILLCILNFFLTAAHPQIGDSEINFIPDKILMIDDYIANDESVLHNSSASQSTTCIHYPSMIHVCPSFQAALENLDNNTVVNITTSMVMLLSIVNFGHLNNIAVFGQNTTVECNNSGALHFSSCNNISIRGIIWNRCGTNMEIKSDDFGFMSTYHHYPGITFSKCSNVFIQHSVFQNSKSSTVYSSEASGFISINNVQFLFNGPCNPTHSSLVNLATGLSIVQPASVQTITHLNISITSCIFSHNSLGYSSVLLVKCNSASTNLNVFVTESAFVSNSILFPPHNLGIDILVNLVDIEIWQYFKKISILFTRVKIESNILQLSNPSNILKLFIVPKIFTHTCIQMISCNFTNNTAFNVIHFHNNFGIFSSHAKVRDQDMNCTMQYNTTASLNITTTDIITVIDRCTFRQNVASKSVLRLNGVYDNDIYNDDFTITNSIFQRNSETVIYVTNQLVTFKEIIQFSNNIAEYGTAIYLDTGSSIRFDENCVVTFTNNFARTYGGAIYVASRFSSLRESVCNVMPILVNNNSAVSFNSNKASIAGNSIYFSLSQPCNIIALLDAVNAFNFSETNGQVVTSPNQLVLYYPAILISSTNSIAQYKVSNIMLGQAIAIPACVLDYQNNSAGKVLFQITRVDLNQNYSLMTPNFPSLSCERLRVNDMHIIGEPVEDDNLTVTIEFSSSYNSIVDWKTIRVKLIIELSPCHVGYFYDTKLKQCLCYEKDNVVSCSDGNATIKKGYWYGTVEDKPTVGFCPLEYCSYKNCEVATGRCPLPPSLNEQCMPHRTGPACGNCVDGYTLSFDSVKCINTNKCTVGLTALVATITLIYWAVIVMAVFGIMHFQVNIGYFYAITYFYSMLDVLFEQTLHPSTHDFLHTLVAVLSGIVKLTPRFMGELCFIEELSAIDQQIMHYIHPIAIWLVLMIITMLARYSRRLSVFLSKGIIHVVCLLILLSFTSGASSTSLSIMHGFQYAEIHTLYIHVSPDIAYFQGRHLFYFIVALIFIILIVLGLPLVLLSEPFLNRKINFTKIKPLLDQFQGCYKDRLRWFAAYYMIWRQVILNIVVNGYGNFIPLNLLLVTCMIINFIHWLVRPYASKALNIYDGLVLQTMTSIIALQIIYFDDFDSAVPVAVTFVLVLLPIIMLLMMAIILNADQLKKLYMSCCVALNTKETLHIQTAVMAEKEYDVTVDNELRERSTTVVYVKFIFIYIYMTIFNFLYFL